MLDNHHTYTLEQAIRVGRELDGLDYTWFESALPESDDHMDAYRQLRQAVKTPICAPEINNGCHPSRLAWMRHGAIDINRIDVTFGGFTSCLETVRACRDAGMPIDLHGIPARDYQVALYPVCDDFLMPYFEILSIPPIATGFPGALSGESRNQPWFSWIVNFPIDANGYLHLTFDLPDLGNVVNWDYVRKNREMVA